MTNAERRIFGALVEAAVAPQPPLPPLAQTDALAAFEHHLTHCSPPLRLALRLGLRGLELLPLATAERRRFTQLPRERRSALLARLERSGGPAAAARGLSAVAQLFYYGDAGVARTIGYDRETVVSRGRALRAREGRW